MKSKGLSWDDLDFQLSEADIVGVQPLPKALFGVIEMAQFEQDLQDYGLLERLRARGYRHFRSDLENIERSQRVRLWATHIDHPDELRLMDMKAHFGQLEGFRVLGWDWVELQDPLARPSPYRPLLPGQQYPGLGMFRTLTRVMMSYMDKLDVDGLTAVPQYFHNAVLYSTHFQFLDPHLQGRFEAMCRDLLHDGLSPASWWVERGQVRSLPDQKVLTWQPDRIVRGLVSDLQARFQTADYQQKRQQALESVRFEVTHDLAP